jgi:alpha-N-acetylglucosaminidase
VCAETGMLWIVLIACVVASVRAIAVTERHSQLSDPQQQAVAAGELICRTLLNSSLCRSVHITIDPMLPFAPDFRGVPAGSARAQAPVTYYYGCLVQSAQSVVLNITASSGVGAAAAFSNFMNRWLNASLTWGVAGSGSSVNLDDLPNVMPKCTPASTTTSLGARYFGNQCTFGYTTSWWAWPQWEQRIDWMALHGITMPLASEGTEHAVLETYRRYFNISTDALLAFFTGPGYLPWLRMGNMHSYAGPATESFFAQRAELGLRIADRMRDLGMIPVLPAFDGHVPTPFAVALNGTAVFIRGASWNAYGPTYSENFILSPQDPHFAVIAAAFGRVVTELFGPSIAYAADTWNELDPPTSDPGFLAASGLAVFNGIKSTNPNSTWIMQGWTFAAKSTFWVPSAVEAYLSEVPFGELVILDLMSDLVPVFPSTSGYFGHHFVWCMLHNFGGRRGIYGNASLLVSAPQEAWAAYPNMVGTGLTMEATDQNVFLYELFLEASWSAGPWGIVETVAFASSYASARYPLPAGGRPMD